MILLFIADGRSPTALSWMKYWVKPGNSIHLVSTYYCDPPTDLASIQFMPVAFGNLAGKQVKNPKVASNAPGLAGRLRGQLRLLRYYIGPLSLPYYQSRYHRLLKEINPDLVHALRIPFEGMLAASTPKGIPVVVSTWGNDLTLHARGSSLMGNLTRRALARTDGLISDTLRDIRLASAWGFSSQKPTLIVPGSGGIRLDAIGSSSGVHDLPEELPDGPVIVNPRGQRPGSLRQDVFFRAIPIVLEQIPKAVFVCPALQGDVESERLVDLYGIRSRTKLWPSLEQPQLWKLFQKSQVYVSPSIHDGTPNSLLEAMACGCFPVVGNTESMAEWIRPGINGLIADSREPHSLAEAIVQAINQPVLRKEAAKFNAILIEERANFAPNMVRVKAFYQKFISEF